MKIDLRLVVLVHCNVNLLTVCSNVYEGIMMGGSK